MQQSRMKCLNFINIIFCNEQYLFTQVKLFNDLEFRLKISALPNSSTVRLSPQLKPKTSHGTMSFNDPKMYTDFVTVGSPPHHSFDIVSVNSDPGWCVSTEKQLVCLIILGADFRGNRLGPLDVPAPDLLTFNQSSEHTCLLAHSPRNGELSTPAPISLFCFPSPSL